MQIIPLYCIWARHIYLTMFERFSHNGLYQLGEMGFLFTILTQHT